MGGDGHERSDPVLLRSLLRLRRVLAVAQIVAGLRPVDPRLRRLLQGHRRQLRRSLRPPHLLLLLLRSPVVRPRGRRRPVPGGVPPHVAFRVPRCAPAAARGYVRLHAGGSARADVPQHGRRRRCGAKLPRDARDRYRHNEGFLGLSGAILVQIYQTILGGNPSSFLLMLALLPSTLTFLLMSFVEVQYNSSTSEKKFLDAFSLISLVIAGYLMFVIIGEPVITKSSAVHVLSFMVLLLLLLSLVIIAVKTQMRDSELLTEGSFHESIRLIDGEILSGVHEQKISDPQMAVNTCIKRDHIETDKSTTVTAQSSSSQEFLLVPKEENISTSQAMMTLNFWLLFIAMACGMGSGLATVNNISQIGSSLGYTSLETSTLVSLWSIWNFLGRFGIGYISDNFLRVRGWPRPLFIVLTLATMSVGHAVISSGLPGSLYVGSIIVGVSYGSQWALMPSITSEIFGLRHFGTIFNTIAIASPCGSYILSVRVVGYIYDRESSFSPSGLQSCMGRHCFMLSFLIMASGTLLGSAVAVVLFYRTRKFYKRVISRAQNL